MQKMFCAMVEETIVEKMWECKPDFVKKAQWAEKIIAVGVENNHLCDLTPETPKREPRYPKTFNLSVETVRQIKEIRSGGAFDTDVSVVIAGIDLLYRTRTSRPGNEDQIRGLV